MSDPIRERDEGKSHEDSSIKIAGFYVGEGLYGIDIMRIKEVIQSRHFPVRTVPHAPKIIEGVVTLRGVVIPIVDLRERFNIAIDEAKARVNKLIIVSVHGRIVGLKVDRVLGEVRVPSSKIRPAPSMLRHLELQDDQGKGSDNFFSGVCKLEDDVLFLINLDGLFSHGGEKQ